MINADPSINESTDCYTFSSICNTKILKLSATASKVLKSRWHTNAYGCKVHRQWLPRLCRLYCKLCKYWCVRLIVNRNFQSHYKSIVIDICFFISSLFVITPLKFRQSRFLDIKSYFATSDYIWMQNWTRMWMLSISW